MDSKHEVRKPLGATKSRTVKAATYTTSLPNAPKGEYAVVQFATAFSAKETPTKTVVPVLKDGRTWRVSAYFIK